MAKKATKKKKTAKIADKVTDIKRHTDEAVKDKEITKKPSEFKAYIAWKAMPAILKGKPESAIKEMGINDEETLELCKIPSQREFARRFNLRPGTLTTWNEKIDELGLLKEHDKNMQKLTQNVDMAFYRHTLNHGDAPRVALWHKLYGKLRDEPLGSEDATPTVVNQHFTQNIIKIGKEYDEKLHKEYEKHIDDLPDEPYEVSGGE